MKGAQPPSGGLLALAAVLALVAAALALGIVRSFELVTGPAFLPSWAPGIRVPVPPVGPAPATRTADGVTLVILDGLRVDVSRALPELNRLRTRGEEAVARVEFPSYSRVGYATLLTGAGPRVHGYLSNHNTRPSPVASVVDVARAAGVRTRFFNDGNSWIPAMFPAAFDEVAPFDDAAVARLGAAPWPHLNVVYMGEPDEAEHEFGGASPEALAAARQVDAAVGRIARALDLRREALIVTADHGHVDRGGHGGNEDVVMHVPVVAAGAGTSLAGVARLEDLAPRIAALLALPPPPAASVAPAPGDAPAKLLLRALIAAAVVFGVAEVVRRAAPSPGDVAFAALGIAIAAGLYSLRGYPWSLSAGQKRDVLFGFELFAIAAAGWVAGARLARSGAGHAAAALLLATMLAAAAFAQAGPTAATALDHPRAMWLAVLAAIELFTAALGALGLGIVVKIHAPPAEE